MLIGESILAGLASKLAGLVLDGVATRARAVVLGPEERRIVDSACLRTLEAVLSREQAIRPEEVDLALQLLGEVVNRSPVTELPMVEERVSATDVARWEARLIEIGVDLKTLPVDLRVVLDALFSELPGALREEAARHDSAVFGMVVIEHLRYLADRAAELREQVSLLRLTSTLPFAAQLQHALDTSVGIAQAADTPYRTSNLLVALIGLPGSVTRRCLDATRSGLGLEMRAWLMSNVARAGLHQGESFVPFAWAEREDVRIAQRLALSEKCSFVSEAHLLLAVLDSPSRTVRAMRENLGGYFVRLRAEVARAPRAQPAALTPEDGVSSWPTSDQRLPSP